MARLEVTADFLAVTKVQDGYKCNSIIANFRRNFSRIILLIVGLMGLWLLVNFGILAVSWFRSYVFNIGDTPKTYYADLRHDKSQIGKYLIISAIKAQPEKQVWFGHIWVIWQDIPPLSDGGRESGFYARSKSEAAETLIKSVLSPYGWLTGQKLVAGIMKDDDGLYRHWQLKIRVDEAQYQRAVLVDNKWRHQQSYVLRPAFDGKTISCRDYVFEVASTIGMKTKPNDWDKFPPESFMELLKLNNINTNPEIAPTQLANLGQ